MNKPSKWEEYLYLVEFTYNNGYQVALKMSLFESLYGRKCSVPINWDKSINMLIIGPEMFQDIKGQVLKIEQNLKMA